MLDKYSKSQPIAYKILKNATNNEAYSHAYLFETGGFSDSLNLVYSFIKTILCPKKYTNKENCTECKTCEMIKSGNYPEIKVIEAEGLWIKKDQLKELQKEFSKKAIVGNKKIYIIKDAEKLNKQSANSILKFLEEPEEGIIAILITDNIYQVLETIRSRCQIINLKPETNKFINETTIDRVLQIINKEENIEEKIEKTINFVNYYEKHHLDTLIYTQKLWNDYIKNKEDLLLAFDIMILYYKDILNNKINSKTDIFIDYQNEINAIIEENTIETISHKLKTLTEYKELVKYNANTKLLLDKLIITMEGGI